MVLYHHLILVFFSIQYLILYNNNNNYIANTRLMWIARSYNRYFDDVDIFVYTRDTLRKK